MANKLVQGVGSEVARNIREELKAWLIIIRHNWLFFAIAALLIAGLTIKFSPLPPATVYLGTGQEGSNYPVLAERFAKYFEKYGISLQRVSSKGLSEDLGRVISDTSPVSSSFYVAGTASPDRFGSVVSLGSIQYSPLWVIYRGKELKGLSGFTELLDKRLGVGSTEGSSYIITRKIAQLHGAELATSKKITNVPHVEAVKMLQNDQLDAIFVVDGIDSPLLGPLLCDPQLHIFDFTEANAYTKRLPFLHELSVPRGAIDLKAECPKKDLTLLGSSVNLLVEKDTHPVVQWIFLKAIRSINNQRTAFFSDPGFFPVYLDRDVALSKVAKRYYDSGLPLLAAYAPLWLADFVDRIWFYIVAGLTLFIPALRILYTSRLFYGNQILASAYLELWDVERLISTIKSREEGEALVERLNTLSRQMRELWISSDSLRYYYSIKPRIKNIKEEIKEKIDAISEPEVSSDRVE